MPTLLPTPMLNSAIYFGAARKVLLIDDDVETTQSLSRALEDFLTLPAGDQLQITQANTPTDAQEKLSQDTFDLIVTDKSMPQPDDGIHLIRFVRQSQRNSATPMIMCTNEDTTQTKTAALAAGATQFISKGRLKELLQSVKTLLNL